MVFSWSLLRDYAEAILKIGRSKTSYKKLMSSFVMKQRLFMSDYTKHAKDKKKNMRFCIVLNVIYMNLIAISAAGIIISFFAQDLIGVIRISLVVQLAVVAMPICVFILLQSRPSKNGGVEWKFLNKK